MSKATIIKALGEGLYSVEENFNVEVIEFNIERFRLRQDDIENVDLPQAEQDLTDAESTLTEATDHMNEVIKQLGGKPSQALLNALNAAIADLSTADSTLDLVQTDLLTIIGDVNSAQTNLPPSPPPAVTAAFTSAFNALSAAGDSRFNEQQDLHTAQSYLNTVYTDVTTDPPNLIDAQNQLGQLLAQLSTVTNDHLQTVSDINFAKGEVQAARNTLPGDVSYDASRADLDAALAVFDADVIPDAASLSPLYSDATNKANSAQDLLSPGRDSVKEELKKALKELNEARVKRAEAQFAKDSLEFELQEIIDQIDKLDAIPKTAAKDLWCADLTDNIPAKTEVGIMAVPGELNKFRGTTDLGDEAVIRPGFANTHQWNQQRDGWITPCQALTPAATFYNLAMTPGWQVFRPTFRFAKVLAVNGDGTLKVSLIQPNRSSQQLIDVTPKDIPQDDFHAPQEVNYAAVKVKYMDCDAVAFAEGDDVIIQYTDQKAIEPVVIGFRNHPRGCELETFGVESGRVWWGAEGPWKFEARSPTYKYGHRFWRGTEKKECSWDFGAVYRNGSKLADGPIGYAIVGAGLRFESSQTFIEIITADPPNDAIFRAWERNISVPDWTLRGQVDLTDTITEYTTVTPDIIDLNQTEWTVSHDGTKAVAIAWARTSESPTLVDTDLTGPMHVRADLLTGTMTMVQRYEYGVDWTFAGEGSADIPVSAYYDQDNIERLALYRRTDDGAGVRKWLFVWPGGYEQEVLQFNPDGSSGIFLAAVDWELALLVGIPWTADADQLIDFSGMHLWKNGVETTMGTVPQGVTYPPLRLQAGSAGTAPTIYWIYYALFQDPNLDSPIQSVWGDYQHFAVDAEGRVMLVMPVTMQATKIDGEDATTETVTTSPVRLLYAPTDIKFGDDVSSFIQTGAVTKVGLL